MTHFFVGSNHDVKDLTGLLFLLLSLSVVLATIKSQMYQGVMWKGATQNKHAWLTFQIFPILINIKLILSHVF
jgi:hypothetical protein